jgi:hypothetical protein
MGSVVGSSVGGGAFVDSGDAASAGGGCLVGSGAEMVVVEQAPTIAATININVIN